jgi:FkbM family methyltransferase
LLIDLEEVKVLACQLRRWRDKAVVAGISDKEEEKPIYSPGGFSTNTTIALSSVAEPDTYQTVGRIQTTTLTTILNHHQAPRDFELLSVDVEGVDYEVIRGLDFEQYSPKVICVENWESMKNVEAVLSSATHRLLVDKQYRLTGWCGFSTIYKRN